MAIKTDIEKYLGLPYKFDHGPTNRPVLLTDGVNCQLLAHLVVAEFGICLQPSYRSSEIYQSTSLNVMPNEAIAGDIFLFGRKSEKNPTRLHLAVMVDKTSDNHPILIHATVLEKKVVLWPLAQFKPEKRYQVLFGIKRFGGENVSHNR
jgi:hypothetical protein